MDDHQYLLTAQQYNQLYCKAFAKLDDVVRLAEQAMGELEELQLSMAEQTPAVKPPARSPGHEDRGRG